MDLVIILICLLIESSVSQTDVSSFGIFASSDSVSATNNAIRLLLSWNREQWECVINQTMSQSTQYYMCTSGDFEPTATLLDSSLPSDTYQMKIELIDTIDALVFISTIRVADDDVNYYDINTFCLPPAFKHHSARNHTSNREKCCIWSQRYSYNNYAMGSEQNAALRTSYAQFGSNVLSHPNQQQEGAIKPPMITELNIKTLDKDGADSLADYSLTLHWDTEEYLWSLQPNQVNKTFTKNFSDSDAFCEFFSGFSLEITASSADSFGIDTIIIKDESGYYYNIDMFCPSDQVESWQLYNDSGTRCDNEWSAYNMYHGLICNGTSTIYITADERLFLNADQKRQGLILTEDYFPSYSCISNDVTLVTPRAFTLFKDNMDDRDPISTGWSFQGTYRENLNAVNCPGGSADTCSRLAGNQASTTINSSMEITVDVSGYVNLLYVSIQYDVVLSTMTSGKSCHVYYALDGGSNVTANTHTSAGDTLETFHNQSFTIPDHSDLEYNNITIKFMNDAAYDNEYCYVDHIYIFVGDLWLEYDGCDETINQSIKQSNWTYNGLVTMSPWFIYPSFCFDSCLRFYSSSDWAIKIYDISSYNNLVLRVDFGYRQCNINYFYDNEPEFTLAIFSTTVHQKKEFSIPDSQICGASTLSIRFFTSGGTDCFVDNIVLLGNVLDTVSPTGSPIPLPTRNPTKYPSISPTFATTHPTSTPTTHPTKYPTINPTSATSDPTKHPTKYPTVHPTTYSTNHPTINPSSATMVPSSNPTLYPIKYPSINPSSATTDPSIHPTTYPTAIPTAYPTVHTDDPTVNPTKFTTDAPTTDIDRTTAIYTVYSTVTRNPTYIFSKYPTKHPTVDPEYHYQTVDSTLDISSGISDTSASTATETLEILLVIVCILLALGLIIKIYTIYYKRKAVTEDKQDNDNDINSDVLAAIEIHQFEGNGVANKRTDDGAEDIQRLLERQRRINTWFQEHVKLQESNQKYYNLFMKNGCDQLSLIGELTDDDLIAMGVDKMFHRKRIMKAIQVLSNTDYVQ